MISFYKIIFIIIVVGACLNTLMVVFKKKRSKFDFFYSLMSLTLMLWAAGRYGLLVIDNYNSALLWTRIVLYNGSILVHLFFLHTILVFLGLEKRRKTILSFFYCNSLFLLIINNLDIITGSNLFIKDLVPKLGFTYYENPGIFYNLHLINYIFIPFYTLIELLLAMKNSAKERLQQTKYIIFSSFLGFLGGNSVVPLVYNIPFPPVLLALMPFHLITLTYAIAKYHLFDIKVIATELSVFAMWIIFVLKVVLSVSYQDLIINVLLLISMIIAGILLIRSVLKEVRQREQMEKMADDIKKAYEVEKKAKEELMRLDEAKNQFTMATQHHLRTPLTSMRGYIDLIMGGTYGKIPDRLKEPLLKFEISTKRLIKIVNEFLDISQFQLGKQVVSLRPGVKIEPIITEIIEELKFEVETKKLYLIFEKPEHAYEIKADEEKLKVALFNLIDNAVKYTQKGGVRITIADGDKIDIKIKDTGIGIAKEEIEKLFGRTFERGKEAKKIFTTGRGIGLYITGEIVKAHNGRIWVESDGLGMGSTFHVELSVG